MSLGRCLKTIFQSVGNPRLIDLEVPVLSAGYVVNASWIADRRVMWRDTVG
jgi:hypothetical protein